jgi:hypothetical protein
MDVDIAWEDGQLRELVWIMWNNGQFVKIRVDYMDSDWTVSLEDLITIQSALG